jgi:hypothetical protein
LLTESSPEMRLQTALYHINLSARGEEVFLKNICRDVRGDLIRIASRFSPSAIVIHLIILACEQPLIHHILFRWTTTILNPFREFRYSGFESIIGDYPVGRWLDKVVIRHLHYCSWIFPYNPKFAIETCGSRISRKKRGIPPQG